MSVGQSSLSSMRNLRLGISLIGLSVFALLLLRFVPGPWADELEYADSTLSYVVLALIFFAAVHYLQLPSLEYFRLPRINAISVVALVMAVVFIVLEIYRSDNLHLEPTLMVRGIVFILAIGLGEEIVSRAFVYGVLFKFGNTRAVLISSFLFGLMHLNLYTGKEWDPWAAYWHVMFTFGFGLFACALMIATRSIWTAIIFHALSDWSIVFNSDVEQLQGRQDWDVSFWEGIVFPLPELGIYAGCAFIVLWMVSRKIPLWLLRLARKWKLVEYPHELTA